jgi:hypothetical protein
MTLIPAWLPVRNERILIDPSRLSYAPGYPSLLGPEHDRLQHSVWVGEVAEAHLEAAIVLDRISALVVDVPGEKCHYESLTADYGYVIAEHKDHELHHPLYVWRIVRDRDGKILHDSLDEHESQRTACGDPPFVWSAVIRRLRNAGSLTQVQARGYW